MSIIYFFSVAGSLYAPIAGTARALNDTWLPGLYRQLAGTASLAAAVNFVLLAAVLWCLYRGLRSARREARGYAMSLQRLCSAPTLAMTASVLCLVGPVDRAHNVFLWTLAFACGFAMGAARGAFVAVQVDREWRLIRARRAADGLLAMRLVTLFGALNLAALLTLPRDSFWHPLLVACMAACAAFLAGRFAAVWYRARAESHIELAGERRTESGLLMIEHNNPTWSSGTARQIPGFTAVVPPGWKDEPNATDSPQPVRRDARGRFLPASARQDRSP